MCYTPYISVSIKSPKAILLCLSRLSFPIPSSARTPDRTNSDSAPDLSVISSSVSQGAGSEAHSDQPASPKQSQTSYNHSQKHPSRAACTHSLCLRDKSQYLLSLDLAFTVTGAFIIVKGTSATTSICGHFVKCLVDFPDFADSNSSRDR